MRRFLLFWLIGLFACNPTWVYLRSERPELHKEIIIKKEQSPLVLGYGYAKYQRIQFLAKRTTLVAIYNDKEVGRTTFKSRFGPFSVLAGLVVMGVASVPIGFFLFQNPFEVVIPVSFYNTATSWENPDVIFKPRQDSLHSIWDDPPFIIKKR